MIRPPIFKRAEREIQRTVKNFQRGFKALDLMIVAAAISFCLILAVPASEDYAVRTKLTKALSVAREAKTAVAITCAESPNLALLDNQSAGFAMQKAEYVSNVKVDGPCTNPKIHVYTANTGARTDPVLTISGVMEVRTRRHRWVCESDASNDQLPESCRR